MKSLCLTAEQVSSSWNAPDLYLQSMWFGFHPKHQFIHTGFC